VRALLSFMHLAGIGSHALVVTCHDAQMLPNIVTFAEAAAAAASVDTPTTASSVVPLAQDGALGFADVPATGPNIRPGAFLTAFCNVPCTGDGTRERMREWWDGSFTRSLGPMNVNLNSCLLLLLQGRISEVGHSGRPGLSPLATDDWNARVAGSQRGRPHGLQHVLLQPC